MLNIFAEVTEKVFANTTLLPDADAEDSELNKCSLKCYLIMYYTMTFNKDWCMDGSLQVIQTLQSPMASFLSARSFNRFLNDCWWGDSMQSQYSPSSGYRTTSKRPPQCYHHPIKLGFL